LARAHHTDDPDRLLLLDVLIVFVELFVDAEFPACAMIQRDAVNCCPACMSGRMLDDAGDLGGFARMLSASGSGSGSGSSSGSSSGSGSGSGGHSICAAGLVAATDNSRVGCDPHLYPAVHVLHEVLFYISVAILGVFEVELLSLVAALDVRFFLNPFYTVDLIVVTLSLVLEIWLHSIVNSGSSIDVTHFLIIMRVWRMARVGHGIATSSHELAEKKIIALEHALKKLEQELYKVAPEDMRAEVEQLVTSVEHEIDEIDAEIEVVTEKELHQKPASKELVAEPTPAPSKPKGDEPKGDEMEC